MGDPAFVLTELLRPAFFESDPLIRASDRADYQANGVLSLSRTLQRDPLTLAVEIEARASELLRGVATVEVSPPGFLNIWLEDLWVADQLREISHDPNCGVHKAVAPESVVVDYSAPNVAKEMHIGHLRSTIIGDSLVRILEFVGNKVIRENHIGDWGLAFGMLIENLIDEGEDRAAAALSVGDLTSFYQQARQKFDSDPNFANRSRERVVTLQSGDPTTLRLWRILVDQSAAYFELVYERLGVKLEPVDIVGESFYNPMLDNVIADLQTAGLLVESDGARCVFPEGFTGREGAPLPLIVQNRIGGYGYAATDLATVRDRVERLQASLLLYVVGAPQSQHLNMVWKVAELADWIYPPIRAIHVAFGSVLGEDGKMYRTRSGQTLKLLDLLSEAVTKAELQIASRNPDLDSEELHRLAESVGIGAIKYSDLSNDRLKDYIFSWERMLSFDGNTGPYIQYACMRARSILRRAGVVPEHDGQIELMTEHEHKLGIRLLQFDGAVWSVLDGFYPHRLCSYLYALSQEFTAFYEASPVLREDVPPSVQQSRLSLCRLTAKVLHAGLELVGIRSVDRM